MKKSTGIVRKTDSLGRIVIPIEMRRTLGMAAGDPIEFYTEGEYICIKKYEPCDNISQTLDDVKKYIEMNDAMLSTDKMAELFGKIEEMKAIVAGDV